MPMYDKDKLQKNYNKGRIFGIFYSKDSNNTFGRFIFENNRALNAVAEEYNIKPINKRVFLEPS